MYAAFPSHKVPVQRTSDTCRSLAPAGKLIHGVLSCNICHTLNLQIMTLIHRLPTRHQGLLCSLTGSVTSADSQRGDCHLADECLRFIALLGLL